MTKPCVLFATATYPQPTDDYYQDEDNPIVGLAEWFNEIPALFLILMGQRATLSPFASYTDPGTAKAMVTELATAMERWALFYAMAKQFWPQQATQLHSINADLTSVRFPFLVLDIWESNPSAQGKKQWPLFTTQLLHRATQLEAQLKQLHANPNVDDWALVFPHPESVLGYWSPAVITRTSGIEYEPLENLASFSAYELSDYPSWIANIPAYIVRAKGQSNHISPLGVVTPYGRWLVPLEANMTSIECLDERVVNDGWLPCSQSENLDNNAYTIHSQLFDVNGVAQTPLLRNTHLSVHSVLVGSTTPTPFNDALKTRLVKLPDLTPILTEIDNVEYSEDAYIRFKKQTSANVGGFMHAYAVCGLLNANGETLIPLENYTYIGNFHKTKHIAIVASLSHAPRLEDSNPEALLGVVNTTGKVIVPVRYKCIAPPSSDLPPKVYQKDKLIAIGLDMTVSIYKVNGELVCKTPYKVLENMLYLNSIVQNDSILVQHEDWLWQMDFEGHLLRQDMTVEDFREAISRPLRDMVAKSKSQKTRTVTPQALLADAAWDDILAFCHYATLGDATLANTIITEMQITLQKGQTEEEEGVWELPVNQPNESILLRLAYMALADSGFAARIDWKDSLALSGLAHMVTVPALNGFAWSAFDNADSMMEGIQAAGDYVQGEGVQLFTMPADMDMYELGFVRDQDALALQALCAGYQVHLQFYTE
jgi:hypothetical protein